jgi:hypothetical protein
VQLLLQLLSVDAACWVLVLYVSTALPQLQVRQQGRQGGGTATACISQVLMTHLLQGPGAQALQPTQ